MFRKIWKQAVWLFDWYLRLEWFWRLGAPAALSGLSGALLGMDPVTALGADTIL